MKPSIYQQKIFDWVVNGQGDAVISARAGSGKTTTAVKAMDLIPSTKAVLFLAFNKSIADELRERAPRHATVMTLNGLGHRAWMGFAGRVNLSADKTKAVIAQQLSDFEQRKFGQAVRRLVAVAKSQGLVPNGVRHAKGLVADTDQNWLDLMDNFGIEVSPNETDEDQMTTIDLARRVLIASCDMINVIDFDDQLYMTVIFGVSPPVFDWVFVDEAQDLSPIQHRLVEMARRNGGRIVSIGDEKQAIYGFRGADSNSMKKFKDRLGAATLDLSICYRCPKSHIRLAQEIVPQIEAAETAPEGTVDDLGQKWDASIFQNDDLVICRNSAPLVKAAYKILSQKVAVRILGRDLGTGLVNLIKKLKPRSTEHLIERIESWKDKEIERLTKRNPDAHVDGIHDKVDTIMTFIEMFPGKGPEAICREIETLYSDTTAGILTLCTVHKAKGLEAERVFILNRGLMPSKAAKKDWQKEQESNLQYVALTRAKQALTFIEIEFKKGDRR